jgi:hypothetical protein
VVCGRSCDGEWVGPCCQWVRRRGRRRREGRVGKGKGKGKGRGKGRGRGRYKCHCCHRRLLVAVVVV